MATIIVNRSRINVQIKRYPKNTCNWWHYRNNSRKLKKWAPFTPSFVNRAEDQAFVISSINKNEYLSHCHAKNLVMRHDKHAFAQKSIEMSKFGKEIGNLERILILVIILKRMNLVLKF